MRKILWFTLGFGAACAFCAYGRTPLLLTIPALVLLLPFFFEGSRLPKTLLAVIGIAAGFFWFSGFEARTLHEVHELDGLIKESTIRCTGFPEETDYGYRVEGSIPLGEKHYTVLCYLDDGEALVPGDILSGPFRFRVTAPGGMKESSYYQGEGIFLLVYQADEITVGEGEPSRWDYPPKLRQQIRHILEEALPEKEAVFAKALLIGDSSDLDYETKTDFTVSGIRHIVAVSGLHVSILFSLVHFLSLRRRFLSALLAFPVLLLFAAVTGFTPSVSRACIMSGLMLLAMMVNREYDGATALAFAGLILLLANPLVITSVSYQLSFASVAGIFLFSSRIRKWLLSQLPKNRVFRYFAISVSITLGATVLTVPLCAIYFGTVSLAAVITNLLVLWAVSAIFYGLMALCLLHVLWGTGAQLLGRVLVFLIRYVLLTANIVADFPLSAVYTCSAYIVFWLVFGYLLLFVFLVSKNRKPGVFLSCSVLGLCVALLASWAEPLLWDTRLTVLDVGQGQCLLLQSEGKSYLVDCGGSTDAAAADAAAQILLSQGISDLDGLIVTHYDRDHAGGISGLLTRVDAELLILPPVYWNEIYPAGKTVYASEDLILSSGETKIHIFASAVPGNDNENSLSILFDTKNCDILVTGDRSGFGERLLLRHEQIPEVDVLIAGHHGSKNATCEELLEAVRPEIVCISAGRDNPFGHPAPELLQRLEKYGCTVYRTDLHGDIIIRR